MTQHIMLLACKHKRWENHEAIDYQKDKLPSERKINTCFIKRPLFLSGLSIKIGKDWSIYH